jgi:DNA-directed RNA polymerase specialized sigma24 family protein
VELRFFAGLTHEEIAGVLGVARSTVAEDWTVARAWLASRLKNPRAHRQ